MAAQNRRIRLLVPDSDTRASSEDSEIESISPSASIYSDWSGLQDHNVVPDLIESPLKGYKLPGFLPYRINISTWAETEDYWPRRLLHIPTMTSYQRGELPVYNGTETPEYSVLSYTWGRFEVQNMQSGSALPVHNVPWKVPVIQESHFTVDAFHAVLNQIRLGTDWAWIDIACIDQDDIKVKMEEIGKQAAIFRKASFAYVWLCRIPAQDCFEAIAVVDEVRITGCTGSRWSEKNNRRLRLLEDAFGLLISDPWFTSLWTLQELMMRNDSMIIGSEGCLVTFCEYPLQTDDKGELIIPLMEVSKRVISFNKLCSIWHWQYESLLAAAYENGTYLVQSSNSDPKSGSGQDVPARIRVLCNLLEASGVSELNSSNPHVQYGAAKHRKTSRPEDRIYAIMQIYGLIVGNSLRPDDQPSLDELRTEFGMAVNSLSLVQGQMFVHTSTPFPRQSWCITEDSQVPQGLLECDDVRDSGTIIQQADGSVRITGQPCPLSTLLDLHDRDLHPWTHSMALHLRIYLDFDVARLLEPEVNPAERWQWQPPGRVDSETLFTWDEFGFLDGRHELGKSVLDHYGPDDVLILRLGDIESLTEVYNSGLKVDGADRLKASLGRTANRSVRKHIALLLLKLDEKFKGISQVS